MTRQQALSSFQSRTEHLGAGAWLAAWRRFCSATATKAGEALDAHRVATGFRPLEWDGCGTKPRPGQLLNPYDATIRRRLLAEHAFWLNACDEINQSAHRELQHKPRWAALSPEQQAEERRKNRAFLAWSIGDLMDDDED